MAVMVTHWVFAMRATTASMTEAMMTMMVILMV